MKITGWTDFDDKNYKELSYGEINKKYPNYVEVIAKEIRDKGYIFTGDYHQNGDYGVPIIDNEFVFKTYQREWGYIISQAYKDKIDNSDGLAYVDWAWIPPLDKEMIFPNPEDYKMEER